MKEGGKLEGGPSLARLDQISAKMDFWQPASGAPAATGMHLAHSGWQWH
jgi:hypothetical protein